MRIKGKVAENCALEGAQREPVVSNFGSLCTVCACICNRMLCAGLEPLEVDCGLFESSKGDTFICDTDGGREHARRMVGIALFVGTQVHMCHN